MRKSIGIDLGTTNSCVATIDEAGRPRILDSKQGQRTMPSVVSYAEGGKVLVGSPAKRQALTSPRETIFAVKRLIGRRADEPEVKRLAATLPYAVVPAPNGDAWVGVLGRKVSPQEISAHVLDAMRQVAEEQLGGGLDEAIITVPAYFDDAQRQATKDAAEIAGLRVRRLLNEPTAAALGFGAHRSPAATRIAVCDLGGGTFDISIVNVELGAFEVISTHGDIMLGGDDIDRRVVEKLAADIRTRHGLDVMADPTLLGRVRDEAVRVKHELSEGNEIEVTIPYLSMVGGKSVDYGRRLTRVELEAWTADIIDRLAPPCREAMSNCGLGPEQIDQVLLVGGMTRMPAVAKKIEQVFGKRAARQANPDEAVAIGAATQCAILDGILTGVVLLDVTSRAIGLHAGDGRFAPVIPRNATVPTREHRVVPTTRDGQRELVIEVFEGESVDVAQNRHMGTFTLAGLPDGPAGEVMVMIDFTVDVDGLLHVSAKELSSGARADVRLQAACGLSRRDVRLLAQRRRVL